MLAGAARVTLEGAAEVTFSQSYDLDGIEPGQARWHAGGRKLIKGETRFFASASAATE